jgi:hypothetical protein
MAMLTCPMCGTKFDPDQHVSCQSCPLQKGCQLACCPNCGFELVNVQRSVLARLAARWLKQAGSQDPDQADKLTSRS